MKQSTHSIVYEILQLLPANGIKAVFVDGDSDPVKLFSKTLDFIAVASRAAAHSEDDDDNGVTHIEQIDNAIVGVTIGGGFEHIVNEFDNFAGLMLPGQDIHECTGCLRIELLKKLRAAQKESQ